MFHPRLRWNQPLHCSWGVEIPRSSLGRIETFEALMALIGTAHNQVGVNPKIGGKTPPKWLKIMENPINPMKIHDLGGFPPILGNTQVIQAKWPFYLWSLGWSLKPTKRIEFGSRELTIPKRAQRIARNWCFYKSDSSSKRSSYSTEWNATDRKKNQDLFYYHLIISKNHMHW